MYADSYGIQVEPIRPIELNDEVVERIRDIVAIRLHDKGVSFQWIGKILGVSKDVIKARFRRIPLDSRDHYAKLSLEELFGSSD